jgi:Holliday junction resolvase RusA-like endonuclease
MTPRDDDELLRIRVAGRPVTQGSKQAFVIHQRGRNPRAIMKEARADTLKPWREAIRSTVAERLGDDWQPEPGPVGVTLLFALPLPASAPKRRRTWPTGARSGDVDKLARAALDALGDAGLYRDDAQVIRLTVVKDYPGAGVHQMTPGVLILAHRIHHDPEEGPS